MGLLTALRIYSAWAILASAVAITQEDIDYISTHLEVRYDVVDNTISDDLQYSGQFTFTNQGNQVIQDKDWTFYFCNIRMMEPERLLQGPNRVPRPDGVPMGDGILRLFHVNGCLFKLELTSEFPDLIPGGSVEVPFFAHCWNVATTDVMPRWYVSANEVETRTCANTVSEELSFVGPFDTSQKWKRYEWDRYDPWVAEERFERYNMEDLGGAPLRIVPQPREAMLNDTERVNVHTGDWVVVEGEALGNEARILAEKMGTIVVPPSSRPNSRYINLEITASPGGNMEGYTVSVQATPSVIYISSGTPTGIFYGIQSFLALREDPLGVPTGTITDWPRYEYRGMHVDVSRNFRDKGTILQLIEIMAQYKMNKFHFHLSDDEGWRLEIPTLPELTEVGAKRCHSDDEYACLVPQLGSGPGMGNSGTGHYTVEDYKEILRIANSYHIQVIPEFDMPGHGHAPIKSMEARYHKYKDINMTKAEEFLLSDLADTSEYLSAQYFTDTAINPCIDSTFNFVEEVVKQVMALHAGIQDLEYFHFGGDEVPHTAWVNSSFCQTDRNGGDFENADALHKYWKGYFAYRTADITASHGLDLGAFEDGLTEDGNVPYNRSYFPNTNVYAYAWNNIWELGRGSRAYMHANAGFKSVISHATNFYLDHPHAPDPSERGYYWSTRFTDSMKTFGYAPDDVYSNMDVNRAGDPIDREQICRDYGCVPLEKPENIVGIQGQLWSETLRTRSQFQSMVYPRMVALAERAWHKAEWEDIADEDERNERRKEDWEQFANLLGYRELARLDRMDADYHLSPPGAVLIGVTLIARGEFPGLPIQYSIDGGATWRDYPGIFQLPGRMNVMLKTRSSDFRRTSEIVTVNTSG